MGRDFTSWGRKFSDRPSFQRLRLERTVEAAGAPGLISLLEGSSETQLGNFGDAPIARPPFLLWVHMLFLPPGKKQAKSHGEVLLGSLFSSLFSDSLLLNYFFFPSTVNFLLLFSKLI